MPKLLAFKTAQNRKVHVNPLLIGVVAQLADQTDMYIVGTAMGQNFLVHEDQASRIVEQVNQMYSTDSTDWWKTGDDPFDNED